MNETYTYKEYIDKFLPNMKCPSCDMAIPISRRIRGELWLICPSCDFAELDKCQMDFYMSDNVKDDD